MLPGVAFRARLYRLLLNKRVWGLVALALIAATYPVSCGVLGGRLVTSKLATKLGIPVEYGKARAGWGALHIFDLVLGPKARPLLTIATPILGITLLLVILERVFHLGIFDPRIGGDPILYQHLFWTYSHPAVYIMIIPAMGAVSEIIPTFAHRTVFGYKAIVMSSMAIAGVGSLVWAHHMFTSGMSETAIITFSLLTFLVAIPSAIKIFNWVATLYKGSVELRSPMLYALGFIFLFSIGGLTGLFQGALAINMHVHDTYFIVGHFL